MIVVVNLAFKLKDVRQDAKLGLGGMDDDEGDLFQREKRASKVSRTREKAPARDTVMIPDDQVRKARAKTPERPVSEKAMPAARTKPTQKPSEMPTAPAKTQEKRKSARADRELEILDLNDL